MTIKIHISDLGVDGIRRVSDAMIKHLPNFGVENTRNAEEAHIIVNHSAALTWRRGVPMVSVNHGFMWSRQPWEAGYQEVNEKVVDSMCQSVAHTAPSEWVARAMRRGGYFYPEVVYHGVDWQDFRIGTNGGYVLWNKARTDFVSDPEDMQWAAQLLPRVPFWSTFGRPTENVKVIGTASHNHMRNIVANAGVYLGTVRETFGIGTLEALASGVPVAGFDWGGTKEIIRQGETGYLAPPGDYKALSECIMRCLAERDRLSENCLQDVRERWAWEPRIQQYADIFKRVYSDYYETKRPKVTVIITAYKLDQYLPTAIESVMRQSFSDFECLVVDDAPLESTRKIVESYAERDKRIRYCPVLENLGLPGARNYGFYLSKGRYIRHVDADDYLADNALSLEMEALDSDPGVHIVYGHLEVTRDDGSRILKNGEPIRGGWPPPKFTWEEQMAHLNQLPSCCMMRREVLERTGGYRERMRRNEDAEFWCRATSGGFRAKKFTQAVTYFHAQREDSKGAMEWREQGKEPDWTAWFPWRMGAGEYSEAINVLRKHGGKHPKPHLVPFGAQGRPAREKFWYVHDHAYPIVSVVVTVGPGHKRFLVDALDSIFSQTYPDWECIVVNDTGEAWDKNIPGAPWAEVVNMCGNCGVATARNEGYRHARGSVIVWMDADDYWMPWFLERMVAYAETNRGVIYSDFIQDRGKQFQTYKYRDFDPRLLQNGCATTGSSILVPRWAADAVIALQGGWDEKIIGMEDWDYQYALCAAGACFHHIDEPLFVYRFDTTTKREKDNANGDKIKTYMDDKWADYRLGRRQLMCGCAGTKKVNNQPKSTLASSGNFKQTEAVNSGEQSTTMVNVEYVGHDQKVWLKSRVNPPLMYLFGDNEGHRQKAVFLGDAEWMAGMRRGESPLFVILANGLGSEMRDPSAVLGVAVAGD